MNLLEISEKVVDKTMFLEEKRIRPAFVIVGQLEYDLLIEDMKNHPGILEDGMKVFGLSVVPDFQSSSRITVTHEIGMRSDRLRKKAGL